MVHDPSIDPISLVRNEDEGEHLEFEAGGIRHLDTNGIAVDLARGQLALKRCVVSIAKLFHERVCDDHPCSWHSCTDPGMVSVRELVAKSKEEGISL